MTKGMGWKIFLLVVVIFVVLPAISLACGIISLPGHAARNAVQTSHDVIDKTINADNVLNNYEWFKMQYESWIAIDQQIQIADGEVTRFISLLPADREKWKYDDKNEVARLMSVASGLRQQQQSIIKEYNAKSKMLNRSLFKDKNLPYQLETTPTPVNQ